MLTKSDVDAIKNLLKPFATKDDLKQELAPIKKDLSEVKESLKETEKDIINILDWTQNIH